MILHCPIYLFCRFNSRKCDNHQASTYLFKNVLNMLFVNAPFLHKCINHVPQVRTSNLRQAMSLTLCCVMSCPIIWTPYFFLPIPFSHNGLDPWDSHVLVYQINGNGCPFTPTTIHACTHAGCYH